MVRCPWQQTTDNSKATTVDSGQSTVDSSIVDMGKLTIDELLEEVQKRVQASPDTGLKRQLARVRVLII